MTLLTSKGQKDGMFIVRHSSRQSSCFVLTMIFDLHPYNFEIQNVVCFITWKLINLSNYNDFKGKQNQRSSSNFHEICCRMMKYML